GLYEAEVQLAGAGVRPSKAQAQQTITDSIDLIFGTGDLETSERSKPAQHQPQDMVGRLDRIAVTTLLSLFDMERLSGELQLKSDDAAYTLYLSSGAVVDVEPVDRGSVRATLQV